MDREDFKASIVELVALLRALQKRIPSRVDTELVNYLDKLTDDPCGLDILRSALTDEQPIRKYDAAQA